MSIFGYIKKQKWNNETKSKLKLKILETHSNQIQKQITWNADATF